jgi:serine/threonine-protein kinase HipA
MNAADLDRLKTVVAADVFKAERRAATLRRTIGGVEFAYLESYLGAGGAPVATTLPLSEQVITTNAGAVPPFFAGLLPEGRRLSGLRRALKTSADDELSLLLAVGGDPVGDVRIVPAGATPAAVDPLVQVTKDWAEVRFSDLLEESGVIDPVALPGVQDKASARMISVPLRRAGERFLLKIDPPEYPHVVLNEAFFMHHAELARLEVAAATVVHDADGRRGLLVRRFDRVAQSDGTTVSVACEDACQVLGRWPADKYSLSYEQVVAALADRCAARPVALQALFRQLCFAWLTGNGDVHAKNLSILATTDGEWRVSPAYDLPSTVPYGDLSLALTLGSRVRGLSRNHFLDFASAVGLPSRAAVRTLDDVVERTESIADHLHEGALPFSQKITADLIAELRHRQRNLSVR